MAICFGIIVSTLKTTECQHGIEVITNINLREKKVTNDVKLQNANNSTQSNTFTTKKNEDSSTAALQRNLVISAAVGTGVDAIYRMARSLRASCPFCTFVLIISNASMDDNNTKEVGDLYSIIYISADDYYPEHLKVYRSDISFIHSLRWIIINNYLSILQVKGQVFDNVFVCDSHDTLFQRDVFANMATYTPGLYAFLEDKSMNFRNCIHNNDWVRYCYGATEVEKLLDKPISCSGTVLGTWSAMLSYLSVMQIQILNTPISCKQNGGSDQGIHNYIIHNSKIPNVTIHHVSHESGFVATLHYARSLKRNQFGLVVNENGTIYSVVHQWNRSKQLIAQYENEYPIISKDDQEKKN
jgi:hypothetical protein